MGDMADDFAAMKAHRQTRHANWNRRNMEILNRRSDEGGLVFAVTNAGETLLFRERGKPKVDFYPSTGRWRIPNSKKTYSGGAESFLRWYAKQSTQGESQ